ncbi:asparaginase [Corynebacterium mendelii]|uniref:asparaginase n=1 Tax=Corynebacterium mendelii TaxID=2765362 RepID=A0A939DXN5_9CORY|nr:asparaginase [Corynebacterium mendelii]MBN9643120.1 asparaginase [Corynebacterium mendelii]
MSKTTDDIPQAHIAVITTGGTIACTADDTGALIPTVSGTALVDKIAARCPSVRFTVTEIDRLDSSAMGFADIDTVVAAVHEALSDDTVTGVIVTHGTDSMEETAVAIDVFHSDDRPVVITGAQKPFNHPQADGIFNLLDAVNIVAAPTAQGIGALIVFGRAVLPARGAVKWHTTDELAFATNAPEEPARPDPLPVAELAGVTVDVICASPGDDGHLVQAAIANGAQGLVVEALGGGNVGPGMGRAIADALHDGIPVVITTRVPRGEVHGSYGGAGGGATLKAAGAIGSRYLRAGQARVLLAAAIAAGVHPATLF